jgi:hypothetical protein
MKWFLFETRPGEWLLALIERVVGLAVVPVSDLEERRAQTV